MLSACRAMSVRVLESRRVCSVPGGWLVVPLLALGLAGCSGSSTPGGEKAPVELMSGFQPLSTPAGGFASYTPIIKGITPGQDVTYCTYTDTITDRDLFVHMILAKQAGPGHHVIAFYTTTPETPRTEECGGQDMTKFRQLLGGTGGEGAFFWKPPDNVGTTIPKGSQFVIQTHWINAGSVPVDGQAMTVTVPGVDGPDRISAGSVAVADLGFNVPAMATGQSAASCTFQSEVKLMMSLGHEHEWGTHVHAEVKRATTGLTEVLFDRPFVASDVFDPPVQDYGVTQPLVFGPGDTVKMTCDWNNTTSTPLQFPREMCVFFGYTLGNQDQICVNGSWVGGGAAGDAGARDAAPIL